MNRRIIVYGRAAMMVGAILVSSVAPSPGADDPLGFGLGPRAGFYKLKDADEGNWLGGVQARLRFLPFLAAEASIDYRQDDFNDGTVRIKSYPVMVSGLLYFWRNSALEPYLLAGLGWHHVNVEYRGALSGTPDDHSDEVGAQLGGGIDILLSRRVTLDADLRYIFMKLDDQIRQHAALDLNSANSAAVTAGLTFYF